MSVEGDERLFQRKGARQEKALQPSDFLLTLRTSGDLDAQVGINDVIRSDMYNRMRLSTVLCVISSSLRSDLINWEPVQ